MPDCSPTTHAQTEERQPRPTSCQDRQTPSPSGAALTAPCALWTISPLIRRVAHYAHRRPLYVYRSVSVTARTQTVVLVIAAWNG